MGLAPQESLRDAGLGMALGTAEVPLLDLVSAYGVFGSRGNWVPPFAVQRVIDARGRVVYEHSGTEPHRAISEEHAFIIADILSDPEARMTGFGSDTSRLSTAARSAVKTGTTTGGRDVWAVGFTSTRSVGVWVGNADGGPTIDLTSVRGAAPIWRAAMDMATTGQSTSWLARPAALVSARVCGATGLAPGDACPAPYDEWFVKGSEPAGTESSYRIAGAGGVTQDVPTEAGSWAAGLSGNRITTSSGVLVAAPVNGSVLYRAPELAAQAVLLRAVVPTSASRVSFYLDGRLVGTTTADVPYVTTSIVVGHHELEVRVAMPNGEQSAWSAFRVEDR